MASRQKNLYNIYKWSIKQKNNHFRYMIEKLGHEPNDAINEFNEARGHEQERENLIEHLK